MTRYFNIRYSEGVETIDQLELKDFANKKEFRKELNRLVYKYHLSGMNVYISQRHSKDWNS